MNPYSDNPDDMSPSFPGPEPRPGGLKVIGTLNIIFAVCLLLCGACQGFYVVILPAMGQTMAFQQQQWQANMEAQRAQQLKGLRDREQAAPTDQEKAKIREDIKKLESQPLPRMPDMSKLWNDTRIQGYFATDVFSALILNVALFISGIGLINLKEWGRRLSLWVSTVKIIRLIGLYSFFILVIAAPLTKNVVAFMEELNKDMPPGQGKATPEQLAEMGANFGTTMTVSAVAMMVLGSIYPLIVLWVVSRPGAKAACAAPPPLPDY